MLTVQVSLLTGRYYSSSYNDRENPEWPPHLARLYSAFVSTAFEGLNHDEKAIDALRWLEKQSPPQIFASEYTKRKAVEVQVPVNDELSSTKNGTIHPSELPIIRTRQPRFFPSITPSFPVIEYIWPTAQPTRDQIDALSKIALRISYIGHSSSLVSVRISSDHHKANYIPSEDGEIMLRVPYKGSLMELELQYKLGRHPQNWLFQPYSMGDRTSSVKIVPAFWDKFYRFSITAKTLVPIQATLGFTEAVKAAIMSLAENPLPELIHGHAKQPHMAIIGLPFIGYKYADGRLLGFAVLLPRLHDDEGRRSLLTALRKLKIIRMKGIGDITVSRVKPDEQRVTLQDQTWSQASRIWTTVTPILLDRFPKPAKGLLAEAIIAESCQHVNCPRPTNIHLSSYSSIPGVPPSWDFNTKHTSKWRINLAMHVTLTFDTYVKGPLLLGAGRYYGLGLLKPRDKGQ